VEDFLTNLLGNTQGLVAYLTVFGVLVACGLGVPLPEDISLILGGYLAHIGAVSLPVMMLVGFGGILVGDSMIFFAGRRIGTRVGNGNGKKTGFFARIVTPEKRAKVEGMFKVHGDKIVMIARFLPGVRAVTYFTAGSAGMSFWRFLFFDGLAALASAPLFVYLGFYFGGELELLTEKLKDGQIIVFGALALAAVGYLLYRHRRNQRLKAEALATASSAPEAPQLETEGAPDRFSEGAERPTGSGGPPRPFAEPHPRPRSGLGVGS
jgi:membrane protein DedA with SNARE-associated domain